MSSPSEFHSVRSISNEIISGCSALHMEPKPVTDPKGTYLSDTDEWVKHSLEHFHAASSMVGKVESSFNRMLRVMELFIIKNCPNEYNWAWDKMNDVQKAEAMCAIVVRKIHSN